MQLALFKYFTYSAVFTAQVSEVRIVFKNLVNDPKEFEGLFRQLAPWVFVNICFQLLCISRRVCGWGGGVCVEPRRDEAGPSCLASSNDLCIMKDGDNISRSLRGPTLWQDLHIHIFIRTPLLLRLLLFKFFFLMFMFYWKLLFFSCEQDICLSDIALEEEK